ncbi:MAG: glycoside hydrolase family 3 N-terminal domain-containing protein [bacterium]
MTTSSCGQIIIMGVPGPELTDSLRRFIQRIQPGGFIFFHRNLASPEQLFRLVAELRGLCAVPPVFTIDQEGGRVSRLKMIGEEPPSAQELRDAGKIEWHRLHGELTGRLLALFGLNLNLAPVIDFSPADDAENSLRGRCFGRTPQEVITNASSFLEGMQSVGVMGTAKHFPGYTFCEKDPHGALPLISRTREEIEKEELQSFRAFLPKAEAMMIGHGHFTAWHKEPFPASLSPKIVQGLLREEMGYRGLVMTDDIEMGAIANAYGSAETTRLAVEAGEDMILVCHNPACVEISFDTLCAMPQNKLQRALKAIEQFKTKLLPCPSAFDAKEFNNVNAQTRELREKVKRG